MLPRDIEALRLACDRARDEHLNAVAHLLTLVERASAGYGEWPRPEDYQLAVALGRNARAMHRLYLRGLRATSVPSRTIMDRVHLIQRLSGNERRWQPSPEEWLAQQGPALLPDSSGRAS